MNTPRVNRRRAEFSIPFRKKHRHNGLGVTQLKHNQFRWHLADDFAPLLAAVLRSEPVAVVKHDRAKFVARHEVNGRAFYVKRYRHGAFLLRPLKFLLKRSQAQQEWWLAAELEKRGVPIVRHVAFGERWSPRGLLESVLITEAFEGSPVERRHERFFPQVVDFVRDMARAGVTHYDFHPANLLLNETSGEIRLLDLYGAKVFDEDAPADLRDVLLAQLCVSLPLPVSAENMRLSGVLRKQKLAQRARRCLKSNRDFAARRFGSLRWQVRQAAVTPAAEAALRDPDAFLGRARVLKNGKSSTVGAADGLVLKRHNFKKTLNPIKDLFRGSRGRRDFLKAYHLELCGLPTARVVATADQRLCGLPTRSFVLMEEIPGAVDAGKASDDALVNLAQLLAWLHNDGFTHRDLKETNILFNAEGVPHLIDLDGLRFIGVVPPLECAANLRRLGQGLAAAGKLTRKNVIVFMLNYCRERQIFPRVLFPRANPANK
jgi:RIO-like serine/threonine protein kinase